MTAFHVRPLADDLPFGARISGVNVDNASDEDVRAEINAIFQASGIIVFENVEPTNKTQAAISEIFGPDQGHALDVPVSEDDDVKGFVNLEYDGVSEVDGVELLNFLPWHFDQCYNSVLTRGGVLRAMAIPPEGGLTGFADGIQLYQAISPELRDRFESLNILYDSSLNFWNMKFGRPTSYRPVRIRQMIIDQLAFASKVRSIHPAIWARPTGEKVLHVSPMQAAGIEGMETPEGDALLEALCREMYAKMAPYHHQWKPTDMVIWDNWRFLHSVTGHSPACARDMRRTVIFGDYGLGRREG
jgi:alpha-ketoglutarate-dependent taurine dioxygenase